MKYTVLVFIAVFMIVLTACGGDDGNGGSGGGDETTPVLLTANNKTTPTLCAEEDNVNVQITGETTSFLIEATHPTYSDATGSCEPDFTNCLSGQEVNYPFTAGVFKLFDDGVTVFEAVREAQWWRPNGMTVTVNNDGNKTDIHYVRFARKISGESSWPQFLVLYMDGNMRIKPQPPIGLSDTCFGSSIVIGPAATAKRPIAEIASVNYVSATNSLEINYRDRSSGSLKVDEINRTRAVVRATFNGSTALPRITFRSMFVAMGNADVDHFQWTDPGGAAHDDPVMVFAAGESAEWFFHRTQRSQHNTTAPDIRIK